MRIKVTLADGRELEAKDAGEWSADIFDFEDHFNVSFAEMRTQPTRDTWLAFLAFAALRRAGHINGTAFDEWKRTIKLMDLPEDEQVPKDPSGQEAPTE